METVLRAPFKARLQECAVSVGSQVETGAPLLRLEPLGDAEAEDAVGRPRPSSWTCPPEPADASAAPGAPRAASRTCAACCSASTSTRTTSAGCSTTTSPRAGRPPRTVTGRWPSEVELLERVRRPRRAEPQPAGGRGRRRPTPACTARASTSTPTCRASTSSGPGCRRRSRPRLAKVLGHYGVDRPGAHARARSRRVPDLPGPATRVRPTSRSSTALLRQWLREPPPGRDAARAGRARAGAAGRRDPGPLPGGRRPGPRRGVPWFAQPLLRRNRAQVYADVRDHLRHLDAHPDAPDRAERIAEMVRTHRAAGAAARPAARPRRPRQRGHARGADPPLLRQPGADRRPHPRGRGLHVRHRRARRTRRVGLRRGRASTRWATRCAGSPSWRAATSRSTPTSTSAGSGSPRTPTRWRPRCTRSSARTRCRARSAGSPPPSRAAAAR